MLDAVHHVFVCWLQFDDPQDLALGEKTAQMRARKRAVQGALRATAQCLFMHCDVVYCSAECHA